jgi:hypothetical protein
MIKSTLLVPLTEERAIEAVVPVKVNDSPVPGQVSSLVAGLTRPRYRTFAEPHVEAGLEADAVDVADVADATFDVDVLPGWHWEYHSFTNIHELPAAHVVAPV